MSLEIPEKMFAWRKHKGHPEPVFEEVPVPATPANGVLCKMLASGVCRSDISLLKLEDNRPWFQDKFTLGHEGCGVIVDIGKEVKDDTFKRKGKTSYLLLKTLLEHHQGDVVALFAVPGCGGADCDECSRDLLPQLCEKGHHAGIGQDGFYAPYAAVPHGTRALAHVPRDGVSPAAAAIATDAIATAYHAVHRRARVQAAETVFLFGLGGLGFNALQVLRSVIGARVLVSDLRDDLLREAAALGLPAGDVVPAGRAVASYVEARGLAEKIDTVLDFVGLHQTFEDAQKIVKRGGKIVCVGTMDTENTVHMKIGVRKRLTYLFSYGAQVEDVREVLGLIAKGDIRPQVETARLEELPGVLERLKDGKIKSRVALVHD